MRAKTLTSRLCAALWSQCLAACSAGAGSGGGVSPFLLLLPPARRQHDGVQPKLDAGVGAAGFPHHHDAHQRVPAARGGAANAGAPQGQPALAVPCACALGLARCSKGPRAAAHPRAHAAAAKPCAECVRRHPVAAAHNADVPDGTDGDARTQLLHAPRPARTAARPGARTGAARPDCGAAQQPFAAGGGAEGKTAAGMGAGAEGWLG
eukprot:354773-Chlamydomonas_euryale.AAC.8